MNGFKSIAYSFSLWRHHLKNKNSKPNFLSTFFWMSLRYQVVDNSQEDALSLIMQYGWKNLNNEASLYQYRRVKKHD